MMCAGPFVICVLLSAHRLMEKASAMRYARLGCVLRVRVPLLRGFFRLLLLRSLCGSFAASVFLN